MFIMKCAAQTVALSCGWPNRQDISVYYKYFRQHYDFENQSSHVRSLCLCLIDTTKRYCQYYYSTFALNEKKLGYWTGEVCNKKDILVWNLRNLAQMLHLFCLFVVVLVKTVSSNILKLHKFKQTTTDDCLIPWFVWIIAFKVCCCLHW